LTLRIFRLVSVCCNQQCKTQFCAICSFLQGCTSSKYAPSYYHVMPKQNSVPECTKTDPKCKEKMKITKMPAAPVDSSTPRANGKLHFYSDFLGEGAKVTENSSVLVTQQVSVMPGSSCQRHYILLICFKM